MEFPKSAQCPLNGRPYRQVGYQTVLHHVKQPWAKKMAQQAYYFCDDPDCDVVYFGQDESIIRRDEVRQDVGQKSRHADRLICYCFDMSQRNIEDNLAYCRQFVVDKTKASVCVCEIRNPSGKCCLKDFPKE